MSGALRIRPARLDEKLALEALQMTASLMWESDRAALLAHPEAGDLPPEQFTGGFVYVAEREGLTLGFGVLLPRADGEAELDGLFVHPDHWGQGVGRGLVAEAERRARLLGSPWLNVLGNRNAEGFYVACDFVAFGVERTQFGEGLRMRKAV